MSIKTTLAIAALSIVAAGSVFAAEGTQDFDHQTLSTKSRADVIAELRATGAIVSNEGTPIQEARSTLSRSQVIAEAREAQRLGLIGSGESLPLATTAQAEQIRQAGLNAVTTRVGTSTTNSTAE